MFIDDFFEANSWYGYIVDLPKPGNSQVDSDMFIAVEIANLNYIYFILILLSFYIYCISCHPQHQLALAASITIDE